MTTTHYSVHIEMNRRDLTPADAERIVDDLAELHAAVGTSPRGWADVQLTIPADSLDMAVRLSIGVARVAFDAKELTVQAMPEAEFDARLGMPATLPELIGVTDAAAALHVTRQRILQMVDEGKLSSTRVGNTIAIPASEISARATH